MTNSLNIWVLTPGMVGTENQALGIAERLGGTIQVKRVDLRWPWVWFSPFLSWREGPAMLTAGSDPIAPPYPDVLIVAGRRAIGAARFIKRASPTTIVCAVQDPKINPAAFDLVAVPNHDPLRGPNVMVTEGAPNRITPQSLATARATWAEGIAPLPGPRTALLIGGNSRTHRLGADKVTRLIERVHDLEKTRGGSFLITVSRRTPPELAQKLARELNGPNKVIYTGVGDNPYHGFLAWADYFVCTTDSTSMISDAATVGKPIELFPLSGSSARHDRFMAHLRDWGIGVEGRGYTPFNDAGHVAEAIEKLLCNHMISPLGPRA